MTCPLIQYLLSRVFLLICHSSTHVSSSYIVNQKSNFRHIFVRSSTFWFCYLFSYLNPLMQACPSRFLFILTFSRHYFHHDHLNKLPFCLFNIFFREQCVYFVIIQRMFFHFILQFRNLFSTNYHFLINLFNFLFVFVLWILMQACSL